MNASWRNKWTFMAGQASNKGDIARVNISSVSKDTKGFETSSGGILRATPIGGSSVVMQRYGMNLLQGQNKQGVSIHRASSSSSNVLFDSHVLPSHQYLCAYIVLFSAMISLCLSNALRLQGGRMHKPVQTQYCPDPRFIVG